MVYTNACRAIHVFLLVYVDDSFELAVLFEFHFLCSNIYFKSKRHGKIDAPLATNLESSSQVHLEVSSKHLHVGSVKMGCNIKYFTWARQL